MASRYNSAGCARGTYDELVPDPEAERDVPTPDVAARAQSRLIDLVHIAFKREEIRYLFVAGWTALCYLGILAALLATDLPYMVAILIDQAIIFSMAFPVYRNVIFRSIGRWQADLPRFTGVWSGGFIAGIVATPALVELAGLPPLLAQVIAVAVVAVLSFLGHKFVSFRR
ncbi:MAG: GtrA family protein [Vicinamibacterales bacterium]